MGVMGGDGHRLYDAIRKRQDATEHAARGMTYEQLVHAFNVSGVWQKRIYLDELRLREAHRKTVWQWLLSPGV